MLPVVISFANFGYLDFVVNILKNVQDVLKNHRFIMYCMDRELFEAVNSYSSDRIEIVLHERNVSKDLIAYGSSTPFLEMMRVKTELIIDAVIKYGYVHFVDGDVVFCKEPTEEYYSKYADYDIVYQRDAPPPNQPFHEWTCTGNFVLRKTGSTIQFLNTLRLYQGRLQMNEQECQREIFRDAKVTDIRKFPNVKLTEFPMEEFTCGYCITHSLVDPAGIMVFHANHVNGKAAKIDLLKRVGKWYLENL
jgi:hypothetical protein